MISDALDKLAHYEELEKQERLIELPCRVGDKAFIIRELCDGTCDIVHCKNCNKKYYEICEKKFHMSEYEKMVFLTRAEAEAKLKEMEKDNAR